jgi:hypothetical protein
MVEEVLYDVVSFRVVTTTVSRINFFVHTRDDGAALGIEATLM